MFTKVAMALTGVLLAASHARAADVAFHDDPAEWASALTQTGYLRLDRGNLEPVLGPLTDGQNLGASIALPLALAGQGTLETVQAGYDFSFNDQSFHPPGDCIGIGLPRGDAKMDDDWQISSFAQPIYAFAVGIYDNDEPAQPDGMETFSILTGGSWYSVSKGGPLDWPQGQDGFIGGVSSHPIECAVWDDGADPHDDNIALWALYTGIPEPASLVLLAVGGLAVLRRRLKP